MPAGWRLSSQAQRDCKCRLFCVYRGHSGLQERQESREGRADDLQGVPQLLRTLPTAVAA